MIKTITPIDNSLLVERKFANENEIEVALENSLNARNVWREESLDTRIKYLKSFVKFFLSNQNEITQSLCKQIGRPISQCAGEMRGFEERANYMIENAYRALKPIISKVDSEFDNYIKKEPLGT